MTTRLIMLTPYKAREQRGIDMRIGHEVTAIGRTAKTVTVKQLETGKIFPQPSATLVIATGASTTQPPLPGLDLPGVFT